MRDYTLPRIRSFPESIETMPAHTAESDTSRRAVLLGRLLTIATFVLGIAWVGLETERDHEKRLRHPAILDSAYFMFALWAGSMGLMLQATRSEWHLRHGRFRVYQVAVLLALLMYLFHLVIAFHYAHNWKHTNAFQHVEETSGFGPGIYVSHAFTLFWICEVIALLSYSNWYVRRSMRIAGIWHGFSWFVMFNATVVYGHGIMRIVSALVFVMLLVAWAKSRKRPSAFKSLN